MIPLWDDTPRRRTPVITILLIAVNLAVFAYEAMLAAQGGRALLAFLQEHALIPMRLLGNYAQVDAWWPVFSSMFLHGGVAHVAGNCWYLWVFGKHVEDRLGPFFFLVLYLVSGVGAAALQVGIDPDSTLPVLGASGAISGMLGVYLVLSPTAWVYTLVPWIVPIVPLPAFLLLIGWFVTQTLNGVGTLLNDATGAGGIAWWAHAGGFATGFCGVVWLKRVGWVKRR